VKPLRDDLTAKMEDGSKALKAKIGVTLVELLELPQGATWVAIQAKDDPKIPAVILISADAGKNAKVMDEVMASVDDCWGMSPQFKRIEFYETMVKVAARISNRVFVGEDLCRNEDFLYHATELANCMASNGVIIRPFPNWFKNNFSWVFVGKNRRHFNRIFEYLGPRIEKLKLANEPQQNKQQLRGPVPEPFPPGVGPPPAAQDIPSNSAAFPPNLNPIG